MLLAGIDALPLVKLAVAAPLVLLAFKILSPSEARQSIDLNVIVLIAAAFGLGAAVSESGLAEQIANLFVTVLGGFGARGAARDIPRDDAAHDADLPQRSRDPHVLDRVRDSSGLRHRRDPSRSRSRSPHRRTS